MVGGTVTNHTLELTQSMPLPQFPGFMKYWDLKDPGSAAGVGSTLLHPTFGEQILHTWLRHHIPRNLPCLCTGGVEKMTELITDDN